MSTAPPHPTAPTNRGQRVFIGIAILAFAALSCYLALVIITRVDSIFFPGNEITLTKRIPLPGVDAEGESGPKERINILVMGIDRRPHEGDAPSRTDTLFVVTIDPKTKSAGILGIPRDLLVEIPDGDGGTYKDRINTAYVAGELNGYPGGGVGLMKDVVRDDFNITVHKYVIIDFDGFEEVVDALGGIDVDVPEEVYDPYYSESELPGDYDPQHFEPGRQHMDGDTALAYSRIRFDSDDLNRIQRQQRVIFATIEKGNSLNVLSNAVPLWSKYKDAISTDIGDTLIPGYAVLAGQVKDSIQAVSLGPATADCRTDSGAAVLCYSEEAVAQIVTSLFTDRPEGSVAGVTVTAEPVRVEVQNGTGAEGLATRVVEFLTDAKDYPASDLVAGDAWDGESHELSEVIDVSGANKQKAYLIASWLKIGDARVRDATAAERDAFAEGAAEIVVILGSDNDFDTVIQSPTTAVPGG